MLDDCEFKIVHFTYVNILRIDSKYIHLICRSTQKEKQEHEKEDDTQKSMPATPSNITPFSSVAATPTVSTPVSSPQSTPHAASSRPLPSFETPCSSRRFSVPSTPASPASTVASIDSSLDATALSGLHQKLIT